MASIWRKLTVQFISTFAAPHRFSAFLSASVLFASAYGVSFAFCSISNRNGGRDDFRWWDNLQPKVLRAAERASDFYAPMYKVKVEELLRPITESSFRSISAPLLADMNAAIKLSDAVYSKIVDGHPLSFGYDDVPDCVATYDDQTKTLWVTSRGTQTAQDVLTDTTWLMSTRKIGQLDVPRGVVDKCKEIIPQLLDHLEVLAMRKNEVKRIIFAGHSLGGAVATGLYLSWHFDEETKHLNSRYRGRVETSVITFGSPLVISVPTLTEDGRTTHQNKNAVGSDKSEIKCLKEHVSRVHNIVKGADIVPRLLGPHPLPKEMDGISSSLKKLFEDLSSRQVHRETYQPFGQFYTLREQDTDVDRGLMNIRNMVDDMKSRTVHENKFCLGLVSDPRSFLSLIPSNMGDIAYGMVRDHRLVEAVKSMEAICNPTSN